MIRIFKKKITNAQISKFFQIAVLINIIGLMSNIIIYRYFPDYEFMKITNRNLSNLSIFMICLVLISQAIIIFIRHHKQFIIHNKFISLTFLVSMGTFCYWFLHMDNDIQENFIIYFSSISRTNYDYKILLVLISLFLMLTFNLYHNLQTPDTINEKSVPALLRSTFHFLIQEYLFIIIAMFGIFNVEQLKTFALKILGHGQYSINAHLTAFEILLPTSWIIAIGYYLYKKSSQNKYDV